jgi:hypothetical protein
VALVFLIVLNPAERTPLNSWNNGFWKEKQIMAKKENAEKSTMVGKLKLFNSITKEAIIIADDEMVKYDVRLWQVVWMMM